MSGLLTVEQLAAELALPVPLTRDLQRAKNWPCVRFSNKTIRYTPEQVAQIIAQHTQAAPPVEPAEPATVTALALKQTTRSRARTGS